MKFCTNCGNRLEDTAKFCTVCGTPCASPVPQETVDAGQAAHVEPAVFDTPATVAPSPEAPQASIPEENRPQSKQGRTAFIFALTCVLAVPGFIIGLIDVVKNDKRYRHGLAIAALIISGLMIAACVIGIASCNSKAKAAEQKLEDSWEELYREELAKEEADIAAEKEAKASATAVPTQAPTPVPTAVPTPVPTEAPKVTANSQEMRDFIDEYEKFVDSYIDFMQNYNASNLNDLMKLTNMMSELTELEEKAAKWESADLPAADATYLAESMLRIEGKLLKVLY